MPVYPERALKERVRGVVVLKVQVSEAGLPLGADVAKGVRADIDAAATEAALQWRFDPASRNGRPVRGVATVRFAFEGIQFARTPLALETPTATPGPR
jgi:TonB family protein